MWYDLVCRNLFFLVNHSLKPPTYGLRTTERLRKQHGRKDVSRSQGRCPGNRDTPLEFHRSRASGRAIYRLKGNGVSYSAVPSSPAAGQVENRVRGRQTGAKRLLERLPRRTPDLSRERAESASHASGGVQTLTGATTRRSGRLPRLLI